MKSKETIVAELDGVSDGWQTTFTYDEVLSAMTEFADLQQRAALTKFKADCIYCNNGIAKMDIEDYLNVEIR